MYQNSWKYASVVYTKSCRILNINSSIIPVLLGCVCRLGAVSVQAPAGKTSTLPVYNQAPPEPGSILRNTDSVMIPKGPLGVSVWMWGSETMCMCYGFYFGV